VLAGGYMGKRGGHELRRGQLANGESGLSRSLRNMAQFIIGDRVMLRSGGPVMIVVEYLPDLTGCVCAWQSNAVVGEGFFKWVMLERVRQAGIEDGMPLR